MGYGLWVMGDWLWVKGSLISLIYANFSSRVSALLQKTIVDDALLFTVNHV